MKNILVLFVVFFCAFMSAQEINQLDADGRRHGIWKKFYDDTSVLRYEGEFNHGKEIGLFKYYKNVDKKASLAATKQFNKTDNKAYVTFYSSKGKVISEGEMDGKLYIGVWKYYQKNSDSLLTLENYDAEGLLNGDRLVYYENGQVAEKQFYSHGKREGSSIWYSEKNVILKEYNYVSGELHGLSRFYNPKGELTLEGHYKRGKKDGIWRSYENGALVEEKDVSVKPKRK